MEKNLNIYVLTTKFVLENQSPIICVLHEDDGDWQFLGIEENLDEKDAMIISLGEMLEHDPTLRSILDLPKGKEAARKGVDGDWQVYNI